MRSESIDRVVFIFPGALGDFLLVLPTLRLLRARDAGASSVLAVSDPLRSAAELADVSDTIVSLDSQSAAGLFGGARLPGWLAQGARLVSWLGAGTPELRSRLQEVVHDAVFLRVERGAGREHAAVAYARAAGVRSSARALEPLARIDPPPSPVTDALLSHMMPPVLVVHAGAGAAWKRWDLGGFADVARWWRRRGGTVVSAVGPADENVGPIPGAVSVRGWSIGDLAALLARAALYVGNDSGISHLAGALGTPGVVLFGATPARRWRPLSGRLAAVSGAPGPATGIPLARVPAARVMAACRRQLTLTRGNISK